MKEQTLSYADLSSLIPGPSTPHQSIEPLGIHPKVEGFIPPTLRRVFEAPKNPRVILVSARGATGKTTMARQLSSDTGAPLWRLQDDKAVSSDALRSRLIDYLGALDPAAAISNGALPSLIIDSMDEARLRVTGQSWVEFMDAIVEYANLGLTMVILGRTSTIEEAWVHMEDSRVSLAFIEISHFADAQQIRYVDTHALRGAQDATPAYKEARDSVLQTLRSASDSGLDATFTGYAPVLDAVARLVSHGANYARIASEFDSSKDHSKRIEVLKRILVALLEREQTKLTPLANDIGVAPEQVYTPEEQLDWLAHESLDAPPPRLAWCPTDKRRDYVDRLQTFRGEHPFRDDQSWASPVFASFVGASRFHSSDALQLSQSASQSGLLFEFLVDTPHTEELLLTEEYLSVLHTSILAGQWVGSQVTVTLESGAQPADHVRAEFALITDSMPPRSLTADVALEQEGVLHLTGPLSNLSVRFPGVVEVSSRSDSVDLGPDLFLQANTLRIHAQTVHVSRAREVKDDTFLAGVELEISETFRTAAMLGGVVTTDDLSIAIPEESPLRYPWIDFRVPPVTSDAVDAPRARRLLDKLMNLTRSHGHAGERAVYVKKLQGRQGFDRANFQRALEALVMKGVVHTEGEIVFFSESWEEYRYDGKRREGQRTYEANKEIWDDVLHAIDEATN